MSPIDADHARVMHPLRKNHDMVGRLHDLIVRGDNAAWDHRWRGGRVDAPAIAKNTALGQEGRFRIVVQVHSAGPQCERRRPASAMEVGRWVDRQSVRSATDRPTPPRATCR